MAPNTMSSAGRVSAVLAIMLAMMASTVPARIDPGDLLESDELVGKAAPAQDAKRAAHLVFQAGGRGPASTGAIGSRELRTQRSRRHVRPDGRHANGVLRFSGGNRNELLRAIAWTSFTANAQATVPTNTPAFAGRSWQLVKFQGSDGTTLTPDDRARYTIEFVADGQLTARVDCNRGRGTWKSSGPNQVQFGPLALTRAKCPGALCTIKS